MKKIVLMVLVLPIFLSELQIILSGKSITNSWENFYNVNYQENRKVFSEYRVSRLSEPMKIDGNWDKPQWQKYEVENSILAPGG